MERTNIRNGEHVSVFASVAAIDDETGTWRVAVRGAVYEPGVVSLRKRVLLRLLKKLVNVVPDHSNQHIFERRIRFFIAATLPGKQVALRVGDEIYPQKKSKRNGQFRGNIRLTRDQLDNLETQGWLDRHRLRLEVLVPDQSEGSFGGHACLVPETGVSVISDIDDTMKHTGVTNRRELLANTFLRPFHSIPGMADVYQNWSRQGALFHYVSSSPWQLYEPLRELCDEARFPFGTFHLRSFRLRDHMLRRLLLIRRPGKGATIRSLFEMFPRRQFMLIGDSGERDAELYGAAARRFPNQTLGVYIRQLAEKPLDEARIQKAFRGVPTEKCHFFTASSELPEQLKAEACLV